jgi:hypothetical protein
LQDGYTLKVNKLEPVDKGILKLTNPKIELLKDCHMLLKGTAELTNEVKSCEVCLYMRNTHYATQCYLSEPSPSFKHSLSTVLSEKKKVAVHLKKGVGGDFHERLYKPEPV